MSRTIFYFSNLDKAAYAHPISRLANKRDACSADPQQTEAQSDR